MPFIPALNTMRVSLNFLSSHGEAATNVIYVRDTLGAPDVARMNALIDAIEVWLNTIWDTEVSNQWQTDFISVRRMNVAEDIVATRILTVNGAHASPSLPAQDTVAISLRSGLAGRSRRGRLYHVGLREDLVNGSTLTSAATTAMVFIYMQLLGQIEGIDMQWVVASFVSGGSPRATALLTPITDIILTDPIVDSMDSRKPRL